MFICIDRLGFSLSSDDDKFVASDLSSSQESEAVEKNI
jgi:hypothetical protein